MRLAWAEFFEEYDLVLCPVAVTRPSRTTTRTRATNAPSS